MRYLPLTDADRSDMLARIGVADIDALFADIPADKRLDGTASTCRTAKGEMEVERALGRMAAQNVAGRLGAVLRRRRRLQAPRAGDRRSPDPALGVPHLLHALSARDRAGHAAIPVRVPDAGGDAHRHGGGQRLHVRRLDRRRRGGADGASRHQAAQGGALRQPASALPRDASRPCRALAGTRSSRCRRRRRASGGHRWPRSTTRRACVVVQTPDFYGHLRDLAADRREGARRRRAADRGGHRGRLARPGRAAGRDGRRHRRRRGPVDRQRA